MTGKQRYDQFCPVASALDIIGNRWALLVLRELTLGPRRFKDIHLGLETASTDMVAARLRELTEAGLVERLEDRRYQLTAAGDALAPVSRALLIWSYQVTFRNTIAEGTTIPSTGLPRRVLNILGCFTRTTPPRSVNTPTSLVIGDLRAVLLPQGVGYKILEGTNPDATGTITFEPNAFVEFGVGLSTAAELRATDRLHLSGDEAELVLKDIEAVLQSVWAEIAEFPMSATVG
ncbi:MAG: winged helix-turn-helix transcriptional regulator [Acidimicrobiales bacterium]